MATVVTMPKWGLTMTSGKIAGWHYEEGAEITAGEPLLVVETEKAVNDVDAPASGTLLKIVSPVGDDVAVADPVAVIVAPGETLNDEELAGLIRRKAGAAAPAEATADVSAGRAPRVAARDATGRINASPAARRLAAKLEVNLGTVEATGPSGRITSEDVERAAASDGSVRTGTVVVGDGVEIGYVQAGRANGRPGLVFVHGLGGTRATWESVLGSLVEKNQVCALDLPGHGESSKRRESGEEFGFDDLVELIEAAVAAVPRLSRPVVLVGHSLGAAVAVGLARRHAEQVAGLVLVDSAGLGTEVSGELLALMEAEASAEVARGLLGLFYADEGLLTERAVAEFHQARVGGEAAQRAIARSVFGADGQRIAFGEQLSAITVPVLVIWGAEDRVFAVEQAVEALRVLPDAWLHVMAGVGHVPQIEAAEAFGQQIERFVRAIAPDAA